MDDVNSKSGKRIWLQRFSLITLGILFALIVGEIAARIAVRWRFTPERIYAMTTHTSTKGLYTSHPNLPYMLAPNYGSHNSYGFKGEEFEFKKDPRVMRVVVVGGSSTYGFDKPYAVVLEQLLNEAGIRSEVLNAGVPGWVSTENLINLQLRILPLEPDLVIVYQGRNELLPQAFNDFRADYSHYRRSDYSFSTTNFMYKPLFRISHLFMILSTFPVDRFGFSTLEENPVYGTMRYENRPTTAETIQNLSDPERTIAYRNNVESMVLLLKDRNIPIILGTMAFIPDKIATYGVLTDDPDIFRPLQVQMDRNNRVVRETGAKYEVPVAETAVLSDDPELFFDDVHVSEEGHARRAQIIFDTILSHGIFNVDKTTSSRIDN